MPETADPRAPRRSPARPAAKASAETSPETPPEALGKVPRKTPRKSPSNPVPPPAPEALAAPAPAAPAPSPARLPRQRAPGRRRLQGALNAEAVTEATRDDILHAATAEFARSGYEAASIAAIAAQTRTSKRMLYYHFGGKAQLYAAVLEAAYARVRRVDPPEGLAGTDPMAALRQYAVSAFDSFMRDPAFVRLVLYENLAGAQVVRQSQAIAAISAENLRSLQAIVEAGRRAGVMRGDFRVLDLFLTVVSMSFHAVSNRGSVQASLNIDMLAAPEAAMRRQLVADLVTRYAAQPG